MRTSLSNSGAHRRETIHHLLATGQHVPGHSSVWPMVTVWNWPCFSWGSDLCSLKSGNNLINKEQLKKKNMNKPYDCKAQESGAMAMWVWVSQQGWSAASSHLNNSFHSHPEHVYKSVSPWWCTLWLNCNAT